MAVKLLINIKFKSLHYRTHLSMILLAQVIFQMDSAVYLITLTLFRLTTSKLAIWFNSEQEHTTYMDGVLTPKSMLVMHSYYLFQLRCLYQQRVTQHHSTKSKLTGVQCQTYKKQVVHSLLPRITYRCAHQLLLHGFQLSVELLHILYLHTHRLV